MAENTTIIGIGDLECFTCHKKISLPNFVKDNYSGSIQCNNRKCDAIYKIKIAKGHVQKYEPTEPKIIRETEYVLHLPSDDPKVIEALESIAGKKLKQIREKRPT